MTVCRSLVVLALVVPVAQAAPNFAPVREPVATVSVAKGEGLRYRDGALSGEIRNREVKRVLCDLARVTGARFILSGGSLPDRPVWARLSNTALPIALRQILGGLSFVVYPRAEGVAVKVYSDEKGPRARDEALRCDGSGEPSARSSEARRTAGSEASRDSESAAGPAGTPADPKNSPHAEEAPAPGTLDQGSGGMADQGSLYRRVAQAAEGLQSENPRQQLDAVQELLALKDPRASPALVELALTPSGSSNNARLRVVDTLWRHAADLEYSDEESVEGLRALAEDSDPAVAGIAREALRDMQEYLPTEAPD